MCLIEASDRSNSVARTCILCTSGVSIDRSSCCCGMWVMKSAVESTDDLPNCLLADYPMVISNKLEWSSALTIAPIKIDRTHLRSEERTSSLLYTPETTEDEWNGETRLFCNSDSYGELRIFLFSSLNTFSSLDTSSCIQRTMCNAQL